MERPSFGDWLKDQIGPRTYGQIAEYVGVSPATVSRWVTGSAVPEYRNLLRLAAYLKVDLSAIEAMLPQAPTRGAAPVLPEDFARQVAEELRRLRLNDEVLPVASAGHGTPTDATEWHPAITGRRHGRLVPVEVTGDCLRPRINAGEIVWVNTEASPRPGDVVLAEVDGERSLKELERDPASGQLFLTRRDGKPAIAVGPSVVIVGPVDLVQRSP